MWQLQATFSAEIDQTWRSCIDSTPWVVRMLEAIPFELIPRGVPSNRMLTVSVTIFWALEGLGVSWPPGDLDIVVLLVINAIAAMGFIKVERRAASATLEAVAS